MATSSTTKYQYPNQIDNVFNLFNTNKECNTQYS